MTILFLSNIFDRKFTCFAMYSKLNSWKRLDGLHADRSITKHIFQDIWRTGITCGQPPSAAGLTTYQSPYVLSAQVVG